MDQLKLQVYVEGCIDKAFVEWLIEHVKASIKENTKKVVNIRYVVTMCGGWTNVVKRSLDGVKASGSRYLVLGFIDADEGLSAKVHSVCNIVRQYVEDELKNNAYNVACKLLSMNKPVIQIEIEGAKASYRAYIILLCDIPHKIGSIEDVLWDMINEKCGCKRDSISISCSKCPCIQYSHRFKKLSIITILASCICKWSPVYVGEDVCGVDVKEALEELQLIDTRAGSYYFELLKELIILELSYLFFK